MAFFVGAFRITGASANLSSIAFTYFFRENPFRALEVIDLKLVYRIPTTIEITIKKRTVAQTSPGFLVEHRTPDPTTALNAPPAVAAVFAPGGVYPKSGRFGLQQRRDKKRNGKHI
jgi:hypothetical protein